MTTETTIPQPTATTTKLFGSYTVEITDDATGRTPYRVVGPRGAQFALMRNQHRPEMLFVFNLYSPSNDNIRGYRWFREDGENLVPVN